MVIFGIDPGTATTGYGVIKKDPKAKTNGYSLVDYNCIVTPKEQEMPMRLLSIQKDLSSLLEFYKPDCIAIEQLFFGVNSRTAMTVGQARGVVLAAGANYGIPIFEYQGLHVKFTLTGSGKSDKKEIQKFVMRYLGKRTLKKPTKGFLDDAADAVAVAICHVIKEEQRVRELKSQKGNGLNAKVLKVSGVRKVRKVAKVVGRGRRVESGGKRG